jgi:hypothetical protein
MADKELRKAGFDRMSSFAWLNSRCVPRSSGEKVPGLGSGGGVPTHCAEAADVPKAATMMAAEIDF